MTQNDGRWPSHLLLSHSMDCTQTDCANDCPVRALDKQSGITHTHGGGNRIKGPWNSAFKGPVKHTEAKDSGGASRYFQQFRPTTDNPSGDLLQYLVRLITPPNGNILVMTLHKEERNR